MQVRIETRCMEANELFLLVDTRCFVRCLPWDGMSAPPWEGKDATPLSYFTDETVSSKGPRDLDFEVDLYIKTLLAP